MSDTKGRWVPELLRRFRPGTGAGLGTRPHGTAQCRPGRPRAGSACARGRRGNRLAPSWPSLVPCPGPAVQGRGEGSGKASALWLGDPHPALRRPAPLGHTRESSSFSAMKGLFDRLKFQSGQYLRNHSWEPLWVPLPAQGSPKPCGHPDNASPVPTDGPAEHWLVPTEDFQGLQMEVRAWARALEDASATLCGQLLGALGQVLWDEPALQALEESVSGPHGGGGWGATGSALVSQAH